MIVQTGFGRGMALAFGLAIASVCPAAAQEAFFDDFDRLDRDVWYISDGWTNGPHQACWWSSKALSLTDGNLVLKLRPTGNAQKPYLCGEVQTRERYLHGTYEARFRTDRASGVNAAFFTYIGEVHDKPHDEIDVEILTRDTGTATFNTFVSGEMHNGGSTPLPAPADEEYHTYSMIWEPTGIRWFVDGTLVHETTSDVLPVNAQKIYLSHWNTTTLTDWMGPFEDPGRDLEMFVDWIAWTPLGEPCQFEASVLCTDAATR
ncbi:MAG: family 16 glycosylhydrolase [Jannaschia sp.]